MNMQKTIPARTWGEIILLSIIWGGSFLAFNLALREIGVFTTVAFRIVGGAAILAAYTALRRMTLPKSLRIWGAFMVMGALNNIIPFSLIAWGQLNISVGLASILNASTAIFAVVLAAMVFADERLTGPKLVGVILGFLGVATAIGVSSLLEFNITSLAQLAMIGAALSYALAGIWARKTLQGMPPQVAATGMAICSAVVIVPVAIIAEGIPTFDYAPSTWAALVHLAVFATALAYLLYYRILAAAGAGNLLLVTLTVAPVAIIMGVVVLGEELQSQAYVGFGLLVTGLLVLDGRVFRRRRITKLT